jgi:hypothetical protein
LDGKDPSDTSFGGDLFQSSKDHYIEWLNSKPKSSVIYVSFGSLLVLVKQQMEEIARGLLDCDRPFLWVIRAKENGEEEKEEEKLSCREELEDMVLPGGGFVTPLIGMLCDTLWMEFNFGEFGFWSAGGGVSPVDGSRDKRKADPGRVHVEDRSAGDCK